MLLPLLTAIAMAPIHLSPARLRCEYLTNPIGLQETRPRLSWIVESPSRGAKQAGYQLLVATDTSLLQPGKADLWDTGKVDSDRTTQIEYEGKPLQKGQRAWWKVLVWSEPEAKPQASSDAFWEVGLPSNADWTAKWIGMPDRFPEMGDLSQAHWIWYPEGDPTKDAPGGVRHFKSEFELPAGEIEQANIGFLIDDRLKAELNGQEVGTAAGWNRSNVFEVASLLKPGRNTIGIEAENFHSRAGLAVLGKVVYKDGRTETIASGPSWQASLDGATWVAAKDLVEVGGQPYGKVAWGQVDVRSVTLSRALEIKGPVRRARLYASAKGLYQLALDGKRVSGDIFTPGWTDYNKRIQYQTYDVTDMLKPGRHALTMTLGNGWYCGHVGLTGTGNYGMKPMGLSQIEIEYRDGSTETIATDSSWLASYNSTLENDLLMGETYDAQLIWPQPVKVVEQPVGDIPLVAQHSPTVRKVAELKPKGITEPTPGNFVFDLGQNMVGWARLKVKGPAGTTVQLRFAEMLNPDGTIYTTNLRGAKATDRYVLSGSGEEVWEPSFTFHGFRYVEVTGYPGKPGKNAITGIVVTSDNPQTGTFECSNELVNQLQSNIYWGQRGNYLEVPTDCPQRDERLGWMGDAQIFARTACFNNDVAAFLTKWMQDVVDAQSAPGGFPDVAPRIGATNDGAPAWGDAGVIVPWTVYLCYGDKRILERNYEAMTKWIDFVDSANPDHLWKNRLNNNYGDWLNAQDDTPREVLATSYFAYSTGLMAKIARVLGKDPGHFDNLHRNILAAYNKAFVGSDGRIQGDTQTAYVIALWFGLLPEKQREAAAKRLVEKIVEERDGHLSTGFVGVGYLNPTLTSIGRSDVAYRLLLNDTYPSWGYSIRQGATTIWERWDGWTKEKGFQDPGMNSFNHYSLGSVGEWMYARVAGIGLDPAEPGYKRIVIHPEVGGGLTWAKGSLESMHGRIESGWRVEGDKFTLDVTIPANTSATVYVPAKSAEAVKAEGARFVRMEGSNAVYEVDSGKYRFEAR
jgi:alpha-L-rhamnosidase